MNGGLVLTPCRAASNIGKGHIGVLKKRDKKRTEERKTSGIEVAADRILDTGGTRAQ